MDYSEELTEVEIARSYLTQDEVEKVLKPVEQASIMPVRIYSSKAYFEREVEAVLRPTWHALAHIDELKEKGSFVTADIVGEPVIVVRDGSGTIRALSNVCRHRGVQLVTEGCGVAKALICPYHTWTYNLDGKLRGAPHMNAIEDFDKKAVHLPEFKVEMWNGFVFVNLDPNAEPLGPQIEGISERLAPFEFEKWEITPWKTAQAEWNWKASLENFSEAYHHVGIHQETIGKISKAENAKYEDSNDNYSIFYVHVDVHDGEFISDDAEMPFASYPGVPEEMKVHAPVCNIYPTFHVVVNTNFALWLRIEVQDVSRHRLIWNWMVPPGSKALPDFQERMDFLAGLFEPVVAEDIAFLPRVQAAADSRAFEPGRYSDQERCVHQLHRWLIRKMGEREGLFAPHA